MTHPLSVQPPSFSRQLLVYVPAYNCRDSIVGVLASISDRVNAIADILVIDNCSVDGTVEAILAARRNGVIRPDIRVIQPTLNVGYAGSQKLAYSLACHASAVQWVAMLHGDAQYPATLLDKFVDRLESRAGIVYGYRSKLRYPEKEETPLSTWLIIRGLSLLESLLTGVYRTEWHSGLVMHSTRFLRRVTLTAITSTPHIDGHLLYAAHVLGERVEAIPIYKLYKRLSPFEGAARRQYVIDVLGLMVSMRRNQNALTAQNPVSHDPKYHAGGQFTLLS